MATEEGLTYYFQEQEGLNSSDSLAKIAANVVGVDSVLKGMDFKGTFEMMKDYGLGDSMAWERSLRVHRGGGMIKDHVYLQGWRDIQKFADEDGDFRTLYVGKVGVKDMPVVRDFLASGDLNEAKYVPDFIDS